VVAIRLPDDEILTAVADLSARPAGHLVTRSDKGSKHEGTI
jgi:hypothetical protein